MQCNNGCGSAVFTRCVNVFLLFCSDQLRSLSKGLTDSVQLEKRTPESSLHNFSDFTGDPLLNIFL